METAFYRVDNGKLTWVDLDLPEVIELRQKLLPPPERVHTIAKSVLDFSWMEDVKKLGKNFFFFGGGFFMYFTEDQVKKIFTQMADNFPDSELIFDSISMKDVEHVNKFLNKANMPSATIHWGITDVKELERWSDKIKTTVKIPYFHNVVTKPNLSLSLRFKMFFYNLVDKGGIVTIKFK